MATATTQPSGLALDFLPYIDMKTLSQSELRTLSLCSSSSLPTPSNDVVSAAIDRSSFNESAGSRRQTYSRPSSHPHHRHRLAALLPKTPNPSPPPPAAGAGDPSADPDRAENRKIIAFLKELLSAHPDFQFPDYLAADIFGHFYNPVSFIAVSPPQAAALATAGLRKRKRARKAEVSEWEGGQLEIVNKNGVAVDLAVVAAAEDPFGEELRRRTEGMETEEELLGFFRDLGGQWCSRRRKRKIVDAGEFGDFLPVGWKLLLGLKRKGGRARVYCRRYLSPGGQHFVSCKDVSVYLQSFFGPYASQQAKDHAGDNIQQDHKLASESCAVAVEKAEDLGQSNGLQNEMTLLGIENLAEVQIRDLFECHKCNMTFDEKDAYLQHLLSFHQRTTRRYRLGSSVGDGVIVKDGKYECQFCHKVFHERRRYSGHVGIHVRNYVRVLEESPGGGIDMQKRTASPTMDELPMRTSKMDALIEIAQNSIRETSSEHYDVVNTGLTSDKNNLVSNPEFPGSASDHELDCDSPLSEAEAEDGMVRIPLEMGVLQKKSDYVIIDKKMKDVDDYSDALNEKVGSSYADAQCDSTSETFCGKEGVPLINDEIDKSGIGQEKGCPESHSLAPSGNQKSCEVENNMNFTCIEGSYKSEVDALRDVEIEIGFGENNSVVENGVREAVPQHFEVAFQHGIFEQHASLLHPSHGLPPASAVSIKEENLFGAIDQQHDKITGFEELRLDAVEQLKCFETAQEPSLPVVAKESANNTEMEGTYGTSIQFQSQVALDAAVGQQLTTVCVWCGVEFSHEGFDTEMQSDSVGYMCPTCKAKVSGHINVFE